jgi:hypothetical protein
MCLFEAFSFPGRITIFHFNHIQPHPAFGVLLGSRLDQLRPHPTPSGLFVSTHVSIFTIIRLQRCLAVTEARSTGAAVRL